MKLRSVLLATLFFCGGQFACADDLSKTRSGVVHPDKDNVAAGPSSFFHKITPELLYGYTDFKFDSTSESGNFNRFKGHSNLYSAGADHFILSPSLLAGVYYFRIDTDVTSKFSFAPSSPSVTNQSIKNNTIFGHVLKLFTPQIYVDVAGGYGYNQLHTNTTIEPSDMNPGAVFANARSNTDNWFIGVNGFYRQVWQKLLLRANLGVLYSQINAPHFYYIFPATTTSQRVEGLTNKATLLIENAELGYLINPKFMPFISAGLIQVAQFSNSRPIVNSTTFINGSLPQLNMNNNGFRLGAGLAYSYKNVSMRIEEKYYNASSIFRSYQTLISLEYQFT